MAESRRRAVGFIGAGRVGTALARECVRSGYDLLGFADRRVDRSQAAVGRFIHQGQPASAFRMIGSDCRHYTAAKLARRTDILFLTVPDDRIARVFTGIRRYLRPRSCVVHCSGFLGVEAFPGADEAGIETLVFHPAWSFQEPSHSDPDTGQGRAFGPCVFAIDGSPTGVRLGRKLARQFGGQSMLVRSADRPLYHAMCVFVSNFQHALREAAEQIAAELKIPSTRLPQLLNPLMSVTMNSLLTGGPKKSLTGPVRRGDIATVAGHLSALCDRVPELTPLYAELTRRLVVLAREQGTSRSDLTNITRLLNTLNPDEGNNESEC